jgi:hypothetical protein
MRGMAPSLTHYKFFLTFPATPKWRLGWADDGLCLRQEL